ncbi:cardiolipin synthase (CMP-forming), mitochondrial [Selaginella moellendorffii]|uniref:cardiolipin synthase (CMP-forming), mitochondrial n=1 Tax=Selaginella moellendorffii TaxID=88036 RepID=UPI000D1CE034|nr:cardiolipin synthase (CMP-forming), mitochondrial [Selaginella moellendorffii]|eukprot:XP_024524848.1 cardiolipin synthase (CMP-forming), mitochondrial [Selaginella moellendorffii]
MASRRALCKAIAARRLLGSSTRIGAHGLWYVGAQGSDGFLLDKPRNFDDWTMFPRVLSIFGPRFVSTSWQQRPSEEEQEKASSKLEAGEEGWAAKDFFTWPNTISLGRLALGPVLAWAIVEGYTGTAFWGMLVGGFSDWLDGYIARRTKEKSALGSYLDPLADKVLIGSVALSMTYTGLLSPPMVVLIVARDVVLVTGAFYLRARSLKWKWSGWREFVKGAPKVQPIFISKVNTALQLLLIFAALLEPNFSHQGINMDLVQFFLSCSVAATTLGSWACYGVLFYRDTKGRLSARQ